MQQTAPPRPASILIIDDEPVQLRAIVAELTELGFETLIARDGPDGLRKAEQGRPDLILLDIRMPGWDGYETCRRLKSIPLTRAIPVIFLTVLSDTAQKLAGFDAGCVDYIAKPFDHREVLARVSAHLQHRHLFARMAEQLEPPRQARATRAGGKDAVPGEATDQMGLRLLYRAIDILLDEMAEPPGLIELAHRVGTNQARLGREFQTHLGMTTFEYLREQRLVRAQTAAGRRARSNQASKVARNAKEPWLLVASPQLAERSAKPLVSASEGVGRFAVLRAEATAHG